MGGVPSNFVREDKTKTIMKKHATALILPWTPLAQPTPSCISGHQTHSFTRRRHRGGTGRFTPVSVAGVGRPHVARCAVGIYGLLIPHGLKKHGVTHTPRQRAKAR